MLPAHWRSKPSCSAATDTCQQSHQQIRGFTNACLFRFGLVLLAFGIGLVGLRRRRGSLDGLR
jgi:hypothetical protein